MHEEKEKTTSGMSRRERIGGQGGTGGWKRKDAITIAKEIKDARVKEKMPGLFKKKKITQKGWVNHLSICSKNLSFYLVLIHIRAHHMFLHQYPICKKQKITILLTICSLTVFPYSSTVLIF